MSGHLADVTLGPKEWTSLILDLKRKWEELKSYNSTTYSLRKVTSEKPKDASWNLVLPETCLNEFFPLSFPLFQTTYVELQYKLRLLQFDVTLSLHGVVDNFLDWAEHCFVSKNCIKRT